MVQGVHEWLKGVFDYAGLFPPASRTMADAVDEYLRLPARPEGGLVDRFLVPVSRLDELVAALKSEGVPTGFPVSVIATPWTPGSIDRDWRACGHKMLDVTGYELRCPAGLVPPGLLKEVRKSTAADVLGDDFFLEFGWDEHQEDNLLEAAGALEEVGFKARTGGLAASDFPTVEELAAWIVTTASLDAPVKFTAGLHSALRSHDKGLHVMRHGFVNVLCAFLLARASDLVVDEVTTVLSVTEARGVEFDRLGIRAAGHLIGWDDVSDAMDWFRGIGSCSISEPWESLGALLSA